WRRRFLASRLEGLRARYCGSIPTVLTPAMEARVLEKTRQAPPDGSTHWSTRKLGRVLKIHHNLVRKAWERAGLQPHRFARCMQSDDPDFEQKAGDVIGLYVNPPDHAAVFAVDEKTAIQALDRLDPILPLSPGRAERHGFEYDRTGTTYVCDTGSSTPATAPSLSSPPSTRNPVRCLARRCRATPAPRLSISSARSSARSRTVVTFMSSPTICRLIKPRRFGRSCWTIRTCTSTSPRRIPRGSTRSSSGLPRSN